MTEEDDDPWNALSYVSGASRVAALLELAEKQVAEEEPALALTIAEVALEEARSLADEQVLAKALSINSSVLYELEQFNESATAAIQAAELFLKYESLKSACLWFLNASYALEALGEYEKAFKTLHSSFFVLTELDDSEMMSDCLLQRIDLRLAMEISVEKALEDADAALALHDAATDLTSIIDISVKKCSCLFLLKKPALAIDLLTDLMPAAMGAGAESRFYVQFRLGQAYRIARDYQTAIDLLNPVIDHKRSLEDHESLAFTLLELSIPLWELGRHGEAFKSVFEARELMRGLERKDYVDFCENRLQMWRDHLDGHPGSKP